MNQRNVRTPAKVTQANVARAPRAAGMSPNTAFLLMAQYAGRSIVPLDELCRDYFPHLTREKFLRKHAEGEIDLPLIRIEDSQKSARGVHITDLAAYIDKRREAAMREHLALHD